MRKCLWVMRCLHLARAAILARVTGLRKSVSPLFGLWTWGGCLAVRTRFDDYGLENRSFRCFREFGDGCFHKLRPCSGLRFWYIKQAQRAISSGGGFGGFF